MRLSGLIYMAYKDYLAKEEFKPNRLISLLKRAAALKQNFIPDSYFYCFLMNILQRSNASFKEIDEVN